MDLLEWAGRNEDLSILCVVAASIVSVFLVRIISGTVTTIWLSERKMELKQAMVDQGMSPDEIERVINV